MKKPTKEELRARLTPEQYAITQEAATEHPFSGEYCNNKEGGMYHCVCCGEELFSSESKYDSGCGWPAFNKPVNDENIGENVDTSHGMIRTEVTCNNCGAHLGHVFPDATQNTGLWYCINSGALDFEQKPGEES